MKLMMIISTLVICLTNGSALAGSCFAKSSINPARGHGFSMRTDDSATFLDSCLELMRIELLSELVDNSNARIPEADHGIITSYHADRQSGFERCSYEVSKGSVLTSKMADYLTWRRTQPIGIPMKEYQVLLKESRDVVRTTCEFVGS